MDETRDEKTKWISTKDQIPDHKEPIICCMRKNERTWYVDIAYWTVSQTWNPGLNSVHAPQGFTHWLPLPKNTPEN